MNLELHGKTALITGGSKGIGLASAQALLAEGAQIIICSRSQANINTALAQLPGAHGYAVDLTDPTAAAQLIGNVESTHGPLDILVNAAGAARRTPAPDLSPAAWHAAMDAKFFTYIHITDPAIKLMAARGHGVIINIIGSGGRVASPVHIAGGAANAALMLATAGLGAAYAPQGVRVVGISPGLTNTGRVAEGMAATASAAGITLEAAMQQSLARIPMGRFAEPSEIASAVTFLASPRASYITAVTLTMDGAQSPLVL